jgi:hypothetical protein
MTKPVWFRRPTWSGYIRAERVDVIPERTTMLDSEVLGYIRIDEQLWALYVKLDRPNDGYVPYTSDGFYSDTYWPVDRADVYPDGKQEFVFALHGNEDIPRASLAKHWHEFHSLNDAPEPTAETRPTMFSRVLKALGVR